MTMSANNHYARAPAPATREEAPVKKAAKKTGKAKSKATKSKQGRTPAAARGKSKAAKKK
jgi:hypothetical protein